MVEEISPTELVRQRDAGKPWQLVDVREAWECEIASVAEAVHIPMAEIPLRQSELDSSRPVAVMCHSGGRSAQVAAYLAEHGFARVANVTGGIDAWSAVVDSSIPRY